MSKISDKNSVRVVRKQLTKRVTAAGAFVNIALSAIKIIAGWIGQSQSLIADGIHSLSDVITDAFVLLAAHHASAEPDDDHPYGHLRFETVATFVLAVLLILTAVGIVWNTALRWFSNQELGTPAIYTLAIAFISIVIKEAMYWYTLRIAVQLKSDMLKANAWHHRTDSISSVVVLVGLVGAVMGYPVLDGVAAFIVAAMILQVAWKFGWNSLQELADKGADEETVDKIRTHIKSIEGVRSLHMLRTRLSAGHISVDAHILVAPDISVSEGHSISDCVIAKVKSKFMTVNDITVHVDAEDDEVSQPSRDLPLRDSAIQEILQSWKGIEGIENHERILLHYLYGKIGIDVYLPLNNFESKIHTEKLTDALQKAVNPIRFDQVRLYYG